MHVWYPIAGIWQWSVVGIQATLESGNIRPWSKAGRNPVGSCHWFGRIWMNLAESGQNGLDPAGSGQMCSPESSNGDRTLPDSGDSCIFSFIIFLYESNVGKYFRENYLFWKWFRRKYFTTETILRRNKRSINWVSTSSIKYLSHLNYAFNILLHTVHTHN